MNRHSAIRRFLVLPAVGALALAGALTTPAAGAATPPVVTAATATPSAVGLSGLETATIVVEATLSGDLPATGGCVREGRSVVATLTMSGPAGGHDVAATAVAGDPTRYRGTWIVDAADNGSWSLTSVGLYDAACQITWVQVGSPPVGQLTVAGTNAPVLTLVGPVRSVRWGDPYPISGRVTFGGVVTAPVAGYPVSLDFSGWYSDAGGSAGPDVVTVRTDAKGVFRYVRTDVESGSVKARLFSPSVASPVEDVNAALVREVGWLPLKVRAYLTAAATPAVRRGQRAVVSGVVVPYGCPMVLQRRVGTRWVPVTQLVRGTRWDTYAFSVKPSATTTYRVVTQGVLQYPAVSPSVTVRVR